MMEFNDILTRLQNGESAEALAAEFTKTLNDAEKQVNENKTKLRRLALGKLMLQAIYDYCVDVHPDLLDDIGEDFSDWDDEDFSEALDILDSAMKLTKLTNSLKIAAPDAIKIPDAAKAKSYCDGTLSVDKILDAWIKKLG